MMVVTSAEYADADAPVMEELGVLGPVATS